MDKKSQLELLRSIREAFSQLENLWSDFEKSLEEASDAREDKKAA